MLEVSGEILRIAALAEDEYPRRIDSTGLGIRRRGNLPITLKIIEINMN